MRTCYKFSEFSGLTPAHPEKETKAKHATTGAPDGQRKTKTSTLKPKCPARKAGPTKTGHTWVVVKNEVPFGSLIRIRHLIFRIPIKGT